MLKIIPFTVLPKILRYKFQEMCLRKCIGLIHKKLPTLVKGTKQDLFKWEKYVSWIRNFNLVNVSILTNLIYQSMQSPLKSLLCGYWHTEWTWDSHYNTEAAHTACFETYSRNTVIKNNEVWDNGQGNGWHGVKNLEVEPNKDSWPSTNVIQWETDDLYSMSR